MHRRRRAARPIFTPARRPAGIPRLNRGWSTEGRHYRALEREIANTPGTFFFCCLRYGDDSDFPAAIELGVLRPDGLHVEQFQNRFDL
jgi:hypothetical protein